MEVKKVNRCVFPFPCSLAHCVTFVLPVGLQRKQLLASVQQIAFRRLA